MLIFTYYSRLKQVWRSTPRNKILRLCLYIACCFAFIRAIPYVRYQWQEISVQDTSLANLNSERACNVPVLDMYSAEVAQFFYKTPELNCPGPRPWAFIDKNGHFQLIDKRKGASCIVQPIHRSNDSSYKYGNPIKQLVNSPLPDDFVKAICEDNGEKWNGFLMSVVRKSYVVERARKNAATRSDDWSGLDVYMLGFDSVSHMTLRRKLPKTMAYLENVLEAVVMNGYNIVGDGTPQALIPILTGKTELELPNARKRYQDAVFLDNAYRMIWKNFSANGYVTAYGEDMARYNTFTYRLKGFNQQPTDHFPQTFFQATETEIGTGQECISGEPFHKQWYRYSTEYFKRYKDISKFLFMFLGVYSHDDINQVGVVDDDALAHLKEMFEGGFLDNALLIVMADHGHRFAKLRGTHQGQLEERLPMMSFVFPKKFREGKGRLAWKNLVDNKDTLATHFDMHATLMDILHWPTDEELTKEQDPTKKRSLSLFRKMQISRTCEQAGVETHWCTCLTWQKVPLWDYGTVKEISSKVVDRINAETAPERKLCAPLKLKEIKAANRLSSNNKLLEYKNAKDVDGVDPDLSGGTSEAFLFYQLTIVTTPGDAVYEVTVRYNFANKEVNLDLKSISHVNKYGDRPHCIIDKNYFLATYCVCYDKID